MLSIPVRTVLAGAVQVSGSLDADDAIWEAGDGVPVGTISVVGRLSVAGTGRYYFSGQFSGSAHGECRRCLTEMQTPVHVESQLIFAEDLSESEDDPDVYPVAGGKRGDEIDLRPALREQWLLEVPAFVLCHPDCKGLCLTCGANLNQGACSCARKSKE